MDIMRAYRLTHPSSRAPQSIVIGQNGSGKRNYRCVLCGHRGLGSHSAKYPQTLRSLRDISNHLDSCPVLRDLALLMGALKVLTLGEPDRVPESPFILFNTTPGVKWEQTDYRG